MKTRLIHAGLGVSCIFASGYLLVSGALFVKKVFEK